MKIVFWGTYDTGKPRVRIFLRGLIENGVEIRECHHNIWVGIEDKSQVYDWSQRIKLLAKIILGYPLLILRYLWLPKHDVIMVGYFGHLDVLMLWPFAKLRGLPIVWDAFISVYNTVVEDRKLISPHHPMAYLLYALDWLACRASDMVVLDTQAHADYFVERYKMAQEKTKVVFVGVETEYFPSTQSQSVPSELNRNFTVLFYGQFIPLHGIETIIHAAQQLEAEPIQWVLIGKGQEEDKIRTMLINKPLTRLNWIQWVSYAELSEWIQKADVCLGIFGNTEKAARVIPNKVFQILASGKPIITRDSTAVRELLNQDMPGVFLIPPADPSALAKTIQSLSTQQAFLSGTVFHQEVAKDIDSAAIGSLLLTHIRNSSK